MNNHIDRLTACKASLKKSSECVQICQECSKRCAENNGIRSEICNNCITANTDSVDMLKKCLDACTKHAAACSDDKCIKYMRLFTQKCNALIKVKEACTHFCDGDNEECLKAYNQSLKGCQEFIDAFNECFDNACDGCCERC